MASSRMIDTAGCTGGNHPLLSSVRTNYGETECPPKKFIRVYYFFWGQKAEKQNLVKRLILLQYFGCGGRI